MAFTDLLLQVINKPFYVCFLSLGIYWVYSGDAVEKYVSGKTGFAESEEPLSELPTIGVYCYEMQNTEKVRCSNYGENFNISYSVRNAYTHQIPVNLTFGENIIPGSNLKVLFEKIRLCSAWHTFYKITPLDYSFKMPVSYKLAFIFQKPAAHKVYLHLSSENYAIPIDGIALESFELKSGEAKSITLFPEKRIFLKGKCQELFPSENELWLYRGVEKAIQICANPCHPPGLYLGKRMNKFIKTMKPCKKSEDNDKQCSLKALLGAKPTDPTSKPCQRLQYTGVFTGIYGALTSMNRIEYTIYLKDPPMMTVKEEYLIYDYVGLISSVGGTLGICVGISFYGISEDMVGCMVGGINWILRSQNRKEKNLVHLTKISRIR